MVKHKVQLITINEIIRQNGSCNKIVCNVCPLWSYCDYVAYYRGHNYFLKQFGTIKDYDHVDTFSTAWTLALAKSWKANNE